MDQVIVLAVDGSEASHHAAGIGLERLAPGGRVIVATVVDGGDPTLLTGVSGMAGGAMTPQQLEELEDARHAGGEQVLADTVAELGLEGAETQLLVGDAGVELELYAREVGATVIVAGSRGHGGFKRALLGSVSDHLVRHAPCPVLVVREDIDDPEATD